MLERIQQQMVTSKRDYEYHVSPMSHALLARISDTRLTWGAPYTFFKQFIHHSDKVDPMNYTSNARH